MNSLGQSQPPQEITEVVGQHEQLEPYLVIHEVMTRQPSPLQRLLPFLDPLLGCSSLVVELDDFLGPPTQICDDESHPWEQLPGVPLYLGHNPTGRAPTSGLVREAVIPNDRSLRWTASLASAMWS